MLLVFNISRVLKNLGLRILFYKTRKAKLAFSAFFLPPDEFWRVGTAVEPLDLAWVGIC
jgi:hypothetical protein